MLNSKFRTIFVTIHSEICLIVFYFKAYDNTKPLKKFFFKCVDRFSSYRNLKFWPLEGDFTDVFTEICYNHFLGRAKRPKIYFGGVFGVKESRNPFLMSKLQKYNSFME